MRLDVLRSSNPAATVDDAVMEVEAMRSLDEEGQPCKACTLPKLYERLSKRDGPKGAAALNAAEDGMGGASDGGGGE